MGELRGLEQDRTADRSELSGPCGAAWRRWSVWFYMAHVADVGGMMLLKDAFQKLIHIEIAQGPPHMWRIVDRTPAFFAKVCVEALPTLWFQVSLLGLSFDAATDLSLKTNIASVVTALYTISVQSWTQAKALCTYILGFRDGQSRLICERSFVQNAVAMCFSLSVAAASLLRLAGVWGCSSHILNLTSGCF